MRIVNSLLIIIFFVSMAACKKESTTPLLVQDLANVAFGADALQKMDVSLPEGRNTTDTKVLVLIHGGSWLDGDKGDFAPFMSAIKTSFPGYAIININYRLGTLTGSNLWPTQINDVNAAFSFLQSKKEEYAINTNKIAVLGMSAGAQLALLKAYKENTDNNIKVVVDLFGPTDLADLYNKPSDPNYPALLSLFLGGPPTISKAYATASPLYSVSSTVPPTIIFHGGADNVVPIRQSDSLDVRLTQAGVMHQYVKYPTEGHGWYTANLADTFEKAVAFVKKVMP